MPRKYRSPSPQTRQRYNRDEYKTRDTEGRRDKKYRSPSPVKRTRRYSPSPVRRNSKRQNRYYSESESETSSSDSDYSNDSESDSGTDSETSESDSSSDYSSETSSSDSEDERKKSGRSSRRKVSHSEERIKPVERIKSLERRDTIEKEYRGKSNRNDDRRRDNEIVTSSSRQLENNSKKIQDEDDEDVTEEVTETGKKYDGPPRYLVVSVDGQVLEQKKIYTSNTGPKNAAQKAFNRLCSEMNKKMEITVKKLDDNKGKIMTYFFKKEELNPPIEREIGGRKVVYRHKTVSC